MLLFLIGSLSDPTMQQYMPWIWASLLVFFCFLALLFRCHTNVSMVEVAVSMRNSLMTAVYRKSVKLNSVSMSKTDLGNVVNLMSIDATEMVRVGRFLMLGIMAPLDILGCMIFLGIIIGPAACVLVGVMIISVPASGIIAAKYFAARRFDLLFSYCLSLLIFSFVF